MIGKGFVLFKINSSPSAFYIIKPTCIVIGFYARQHICYSAYMLSPVRLSVTRVYHRKTAEVRIRLWNFHHMV